MAEEKQQLRIVCSLCAEPWLTSHSSGKCYRNMSGMLGRFFNDRKHTDLLTLEDLARIRKIIYERIADVV